MTAPTAERPATVRPPFVVLPYDLGAQVIAQTLLDHHTTMILVHDGQNDLPELVGQSPDDLFIWRCKCGARPDSHPTRHTAAWRAGRSHQADAIVAALQNAARELQEPGQ